MHGLPAFTHGLRRYAGKGVEGIDVAGAEDKPLFKKHPYLRHYFRACRARNQETTCHCGETFNPWTEEELAYILETLRPKRLGHGIQLHRFPALMKIASNQGTELEICISSNFATRVVQTKREFARY